MPQAEKIQVVEELTRQLRDAGSVFVTDYAGLTVADVTDLRAQLRRAGLSFRVAKNTLLRRAAEQADLPELAGFFKGPTAIATGGRDPVAGAKIIQDFYARLERPKVRTFVVEHRSYRGEDLKAMALLPPREVVLSQLVAAVECPISGLVATLDAIIRECVGTIDALAEKKGKVTGEAAAPEAAESTGAAEA
ncbi:MAG: 50S ribosomal protein L10 [candidate division Zixibacteria bacterium]|nr:50S ribosomal protein L10 [candidate division Zixibacteria bacterium]